MSDKLSIESVSGNNLTVNLDGKTIELPKEMAWLIALMKEKGLSEIQSAGKIYNIGSITNATFQIIVGRSDESLKIDENILISDEDKNWIQSLKNEILKQNVAVGNRTLPGSGLAQRNLSGAGLAKRNLPGSGLAKRNLPGAGLEKRIPCLPLEPVCKQQHLTGASTMSQVDYSKIELSSGWWSQTTTSLRHSIGARRLGNAPFHWKEWRSNLRQRAPSLARD